jgi:murein endopeptidase
VALIALLVLAGTFGAARVAGEGEVPAPEATVPEPPAVPERPPAVPDRPPKDEGIAWRSSRALGLPWAGRLVRGVQLPAEGARFFTWDPVLRQSPNRAWRRWGTDRLVRTVLRVLREHARAHPGAPRVGIGDLSRPRGGDFGPRYGLPGHASHQNGLDVDLYYPRRDRLERAPRGASNIDRNLSQDLVDRFVRAGAHRVFVGPNTGLGGPHRVVQRLPHHDNHVHVRIRR